MSRSKKLKHTKANTSSIQDGLFVPTVKYDNYLDSKGVKKRRITETLYRTERIFNGGETKFVGLQLSAQHQSVLFGIAAEMMHNEEAVLIKGSANDPAAKQEVLPLKIEGAAIDRHFGVVETTARALMINSGIEPNKAGYAALKNYLEDMAAVTISRTHKGVGGSCSLLSASWTSEGHIKAVLNWGLAEAIKLEGVQHFKISLHERLSIGGKDPVGQILHAWFSGTIRLGKSLKISIDKLIPHVYGNRPSTDGNLRQRRRKVRQSLAHLAKRLDGWVILIKGNIVSISRPKTVHFLDDVLQPSEVQDIMEESKLIEESNQTESWKDEVDYS